MKFYLLLGILFSYIAYLRVQKLEIQVNYIGLEQNEIVSQGELLKEGKLNEFGWSRTITKTVNIETLSPLNKALRFKQWDYYHFSTDNTYLGLAFADVGYAQSLQFSFYNFDQQIHIKSDIMILPFIHQPLKLSLQQKLNNSESYIINSEGFQLQYNAWIEENKDIREFNIQYQQLNITFKQIYNPEQDNIVTLTPMNHDGSKWFYNLKSYNVPLQGKMILNNKSYDLSQAQSGEDWGRGVWDYDTTWLWITGQGHSINGSLIGINLGGGFQSNISRATEETIFIDKQLYKLKDLEYIYDESDYTKIIIIKSKNITKDQFNLQQLQEGIFYCEFQPVQLNLNKKELFIVSLNMQQIFGLYSGTYVKNGEIIRFEKIVGLMEFNKSKW